jgi:hypothetical protein
MTDDDQWVMLRIADNHTSNEYQEQIEEFEWLRRVSCTCGRRICESCVQGKPRFPANHNERRRKAKRELCR